MNLFNAASIMNSHKIIAITPFEYPCSDFLIALLETTAFPILHLGYNKKIAEEAISSIIRKTTKPFGVCMTKNGVIDLSLPEQVTLVISDTMTAIDNYENKKVFIQANSAQEGIEIAKKKAVDGLIIKGNESGGFVGDTSAFIMFQQLINTIEKPIWIQGGIGMHTAPAFILSGARGVVLDSQLALFSKGRLSDETKKILEKPDGITTKIIEGNRVLVRPDSPAISSGSIRSYLGALNHKEGYISLGQDASFAKGFKERFRSLKKMIFGLEEAIHAHIKQVKSESVLKEGNPLAKDLAIRFPIAQGPMTRVSDTPEFANSVATAGGVPFIALSLVKGEKAKTMISETKELLGNKTWGVGILGFAPAEVREEQLSYIKEAKPPVVLIAGGRPSQAKPLEAIGIKTFLHVPSTSLLDMYLKEGARGFVFEGRECGGHVGPLSSLVLWERQVERLLQEDNLEDIRILFAGGIHDARSAAMVSTIAAPLAFKGAKIGVLMGTSYLFTQEAVESGAILPQFQHQAIEKSETTLLETAPGHETRCLKTPYVDFFTREKRNYISKGTDKKEIWAELEQLNVGRLRIASKGIERKGSILEKVSDAEQLQTGMYMIGDVAALRDKVTTMDQLHKEITEGSIEMIHKASVPAYPQRHKKSLDVAIVGMSCVFPGAKNLDEYWTNIVTGKNCVTEVPDDRWNKDIYYNNDSVACDKSDSKWGGFIPEIDFDPMEFGIPPQSLASIDASQLLSLLVAKRALEDAGYSDHTTERENVSVIFGAEGGNDLATSYGFRAFYPQVFGTLPPELDEALPKFTEDSFPGILANVISGRITNRLDLGGRNYTVDAACASSLAALELACQELVLEKSDMVLAGGTDLHNGINDYLMFSNTHALSKKGRCKTFDKEADGIALGEGVAVVVLKRLEDAERDNDRIYAVIKGVGGASDGKSLGLTAPRKTGQLRALERAYEQAGVSPGEITLIEAHGTGTVVGDKTEISALDTLMVQAGALKNQVQLGSVKTQIGHTKCAAGLAGLIKTALALYHGIKPPTIQLENPNPFYNKTTSPFSFNITAGLWNDEKKYAGVSAFGFGGTNFHTVLEASRKEISPKSVLEVWPSELLVFRGTTYEEAMIVLKKTVAILSVNETLKLRDIAYSLFRYNEAPIQVTVVASTPLDALQKMEKTLVSEKVSGVYRTHPQKGKVAFMFPGQGSQRVNMAKALFVSLPSMRKIIEQHQELEQLVFPATVFDTDSKKAQKEAIKSTEVAQPLLGIVDMAIASFLKQLGIVPDMVAGHSYGELPALCFAGAIKQETLVPLSIHRAQAILDAIEEDPGTMLSVSIAKERLEEIIATEEGVTLANNNAPTQQIVAGTTAAITKLEKKLKDHKIACRRIEVACAFHSPLIKKAKENYLRYLKTIDIEVPKYQVWSNTTATHYPTSKEAIKERLADHLIQPVKFQEEVQQMYDDNARIFIEVGPGNVLTSLVKSCLGNEVIAIDTEHRNQEGIPYLLHAIAQYIATGKTILYEKLFEGRKKALIDLDQPEHYKKPKTTWLVNGHYTRPLYGEMPKHGAFPITSAIQLHNAKQTTMYTPDITQREALIHEYLSNVKSMVDAQRDVILGYLGQPVPGHYEGSKEVMHTIEALKRTPQNGQVHSNETPVKEVQREIDVKTVLLSIVADKTGYPEEMLGMEMDLEADLSIDSIKRMEIIGALKETLGGLQVAGKTEEELIEELAAIKTLKGLINWLQEHNQKSKETTDITVAATEMPKKKNVQEILIAVVSDKTGYPEEMLGMEMDLEADLSIDSIKRMEIIGELRTALGGFEVKGKTEEELIEELTAIKTIQGLITWISNNDISDTSTDHIMEEQASVTKENILTRQKITLTRQAGAPKEKRILEGKKIAITDEGSSLVQTIKKQLEDKGMLVTIVSENEELHTYDGLILLDILTSPKRPKITDFVSQVQQLDAKKAIWVYAVSDLKSYLETSKDLKMLRNFQGYAGFLKSLDKEWEQVQCKTINLETQLSEERIAEILIDELVLVDDHAEVFYDDTERKTFELVRETLTNQSTPEMTIDKDGVVLVLGGAQGITAEMMVRFSQEYPCNYVLVGRSSDPRKEKEDRWTTTYSIAEIKKKLIQEGILKKPAQIEAKAKQLFKRNQVLRTIKSLEKNGAIVTYHSIDLRVEKRLEELIDSLYDQFGRIDGVIHGAGLLEDKLFQNKTIESFERVFTTKVTPLRIIAEKLREDVQFVVLFSSVASVYGNKGQTDYAAANSVLDEYAWELKERLQGKVISINWGPWKGAGMVSSSLEKEYERRGIGLIPLEEGIETFINEVKYGTDSQVLIMAE